MADWCKSPPLQGKLLKAPLFLRMGSSDLWEGARQVRNPILMISTTYSHLLSPSQLSVPPHTKTATPSSMARSQDVLSAIVFLGRGGGVSE